MGSTLGSSSISGSLLSIAAEDDDLLAFSFLPLVPLLELDAFLFDLLAAGDFLLSALPLFVSATGTGESVSES